MPGRAVTIRELDAALVGFLGLGDSARLVTAALRDAGLAPKAGAGTETVARLLGLRVNHPAAEDALELGLERSATRAEAAYSLARVLALSGFEQEQIRAGDRTARRSPSWPGRSSELLRRAVSLSARRTSGAARRSRRSSSGTGSSCRAASTAPASSGASSSWSRSRAPPRSRSVLRGRTTYEMSGEVPPAQRIKKVENLQPGDVIFQGANGPKSKPAQVDHAGIYLGGGWFIHSSGKRHHPPSARRVVPRPVRLGAQAAARGGAQLGTPEECSDLAKVVERLVGDTDLVQVARERVAREDPVGRDRRAAVRVAVPDVRVRRAGDAGALARLAAT